MGDFIYLPIYLPACLPTYLPVPYSVMLSRTTPLCLPKLSRPLPDRTTRPSRNCTAGDFATRPPPPRSRSRW